MKKFFALLVACFLCCSGLLAQTQTASSADIETALTSDASGLQGVYVAYIGLGASAVVVGAITWALRKGRNPG